jgi:hypothetical protein
MEKLKRNPQTLIFVAFIVVSAMAGWGIPWFTEWSGTQQSRRSPLIFPLAIGLTVGGIALCLLLPRLPIPTHRRESDERLPIQFQFTMRRFMAITAAVAIWIAIFARFKLAASILIYIGMFFYFGWFMLHNRRYRLAVSALVSCMFLPYVWLAGYRELGQMMPEILAGMFGLPALLPQLLIGVVLDQRTVESFWIGALLTAVQMGIGLWMIRLGPKRTIAFLVYSLLASLFGSFFFYQAVRA